MQPRGKILVVGGPTRAVGKSTLVCALIESLRELRWTAVKITSHDHGQPKPLWEETVPNPRKGTGRYLAAGAERAFLLTVQGDTASLDPLWERIEPDANLVVESNRVLSGFQPTLTLALLGEGGEQKRSFAPFAARADALLCADPASAVPRPAAGQRIFQTTAQQSLPPELLAWVRSALRS